ncbi:MAG: sugar ABC transporter substrate-binding protein [Thermodesulfobacteriota bacterium]
MKKVSKLLVVGLVAGLLITLGGLAQAFDLKAASEPYKGITLHVSLMAGYKINAILPDLAKEFTEITGINFEFESIPYAETLEKHMIALATGSTAYDLMNIDNLWFPQYVGYLRPIDDYMKDPKLGDPDLNIGDFVAEVLQGYQWEGKTYSLPEGYFFPVLMYRKDLFEKAGLTEPPKTYQEYYEYAKKLTDKGAGIYGAIEQGQRTGIFDEICTPYWGNGGQLFDTKLKPVFNNPKLVAVLTLYQKMYTEGLVPPGSTDFELGEAAAFFMQGKGAMMWNWSMMGSDLEDPKLSKVAGKVGYAMFPKEDPNAVHYVREASTGLCIPKTAPNKEAAYLFIQWLTSRETLFKVEAQYKCGHPARYSLMSDPAIKDLFPYFPLLEFAGKVKAVRLVPKIVEWSQVDDTCAVYFQKCMIGKMDPAEAVAEAAKGVERLLEDKGYYFEDKEYSDLLTGRYN